jgi:hypothetical protein
VWRRRLPLRSGFLLTSLITLSSRQYGTSLESCVQSRKYHAHARPRNRHLVQDKILAPSLSYLSNLYLSLQPMKTSCLVSPEIYRHIDHPLVIEGLQYLRHKVSVTRFNKHVHAPHLHEMVLPLISLSSEVSQPSILQSSEESGTNMPTNSSMDGPCIHVRRRVWCCVPACSIHPVIFVDIFVLTIHNFRRIIIGDTLSFKLNAASYCCCSSGS